ncbi:HpcH/HpaI aldolase/citrate lyase family protein [Kordiimonas aestuarii]|uniref:HpcH/HpaI aldolase/citrate lyase family protein n=1 Tax=Kordiimonas aestuarii TaxID=1005925 RepID=UPI0021D009A3|nr:CoA ester lyase [Kordiimonas aestuarii]
MQPFRPMRSMLFMPASNARALEKARDLPSDGVIFDLEDAVAPEAKAEARQQATNALKAGGYGQRLRVVRINGLDTPWWRDDLASAVAGKPDAVLLPKVEHVESLQRVEEEMAWLGGCDDIVLWSMIETPMAFLRLEALAQVTDRQTTWVIGTNDLVKDLRAEHTKDRMPVMMALSQALLVARAYGLTILDGVYSNFRDSEGFAVECRQAKSMGFDGKTLIHPGQIDTANTVFAPSEEEIALARRMIAVFDDAKTTGKGVAVLDGRMIEELHVEVARQQVAMAEAIARLAD